jgi:phosphoribosylamine--glycine ligase
MTGTHKNPNFAPKHIHMKILILGSGGREDAFAWRISKDIAKENLFISPGNGGSEQYATQLKFSAGDFNAIAAAVAEYQIDLLVVGPEDPLVNGIREHLEKDDRCKNLKILGPGANGAILEGSKEFAKQFMHKHGIPTALYGSFTENQASEAKEFLKKFNPPYVIKADGLAAGKGVVILDKLEEAQDHIDQVFHDKMFGAAGNKIVIEEFLTGMEVSMFALCDGKNYVMLPEAKDYKRIGEGDKGLNTGGMGTVSPVPFVDSIFMNKVIERIVKPTMKGLQTDNIDFKGFIFFGLINVNGDPMVIEYNARMGDPETQVVLPRIEGNFAQLLMDAASGNLEGQKCTFNNKINLAVILASKGYPETYEKGKEIDFPEQCDALIFHAGTKKEREKVFTNGGRVLAITAMGATIDEARAKAYKAVYEVHFNGKTFRSDIGLDLKR